MVPLNNKNTPPNNKIKSRPENGWLRIWKSGWVSVTTQAIEAKRIRRIPKASIKPTIRALVRCSGGNFSAKMAIKTRLSIPSTISRTINVARPTQADGSDIHSKIIDPAPVLGGFYLYWATQKACLDKGGIMFF
ncbi:Uncharacterised protein [Acinetobacter baumannii]|nr:Uncharacterised protein [Acinetobacter baumannii]